MVDTSPLDGGTDSKASRTKATKADPAVLGKLVGEMGAALFGDTTQRMAHPGDSIAHLPVIVRVQTLGRTGLTVPGFLIRVGDICCRTVGFSPRRCQGCSYRRSTKWEHPDRRESHR